MVNLTYADLVNDSLDLTASFNLNNHFRYI